MTTTEAPETITHTKISNLISPEAMRLYEHLTVNRNSLNFIGLPVVRIAIIAKADPMAVITELQLIEAIRICCKHQGVIMLEVLKPLRMARRAA